MESVKPEKTRHRHSDRISVDQESLDRLSAWIAQIGNKNGGIKVNRSDLINWYIKRHSATLTKKELKSIEAEFFNQLQYTKWLYQRVKEGIKNGEKLSIKLVEEKESPLEIKEKPPKELKKESKRSFTLSPPEDDGCITLDDIAECGET